MDETLPRFNNSYIPEILLNVTMTSAELDLTCKIEKHQVDISHLASQQTKVISLALNSLLRTPSGLPTRSLKVLNISFNKLKSLKGLEHCSNLTFLNASRNQLKSIQELNSVLNLNELYLSQNQLSQIKEVQFMTKLQILDLSYNKLNSLDKIKSAFNNKKELKVISFIGNPLCCQEDYICQASRFAISLDPPQI